jgi:hypothetical protein
MYAVQLTSSAMTSSVSGGNALQNRTKEGSTGGISSCRSSCDRTEKNRKLKKSSCALWDQCNVRNFPRFTAKNGVFLQNQCQILLFSEGGGNVANGLVSWWHATND